MPTITRTAHITQHILVRDHHWVVVRQVGGTGFWTVDEYVHGVGREEMTETQRGGFAWYTRRHEAEALAEAYVATRAATSGAAA